MASTARLTPAEGRRFGLPVGTALLVFATLLWWRSRSSAAVIVAGLGGALIIAALVVPARLGPAFGAWMALARAISSVTTPLFLGAVYFGLLTPVGVILRLVGKDPLAVPKGTGLWRERVTARERRGDLNRQF